MGPTNKIRRAEARRSNRQDAMTSEQLMLASRLRFSLSLAAILFLIAALPGCAGERFKQPTTLVAPYNDARDGDLLWAVAPLRNEAGSSAFDPLTITDALTAEVHQTDGLSVVPVNRVIRAMRALEIYTIETPADAVAVGKAVGADAIIVGTVTAWDPYRPPKLGMSLALFPLTERMGAEAARVIADPRILQRSVTDYFITKGAWANPNDPVSVASEHLDGANHGVQASLQLYDEGRADGRSALGWKRRLASMSLFTEFAAHRLTSRLLDAERSRLGSPVATADDR